MEQTLQERTDVGDFEYVGELPDRSLLCALPCVLCPLSPGSINSYRAVLLRNHKHIFRPRDERLEWREVVRG
jgi:hypothetical protein